MKNTICAIGVIAFYMQASSPCVFAQAFGEYGRALGSATQRQGVMGSKPQAGSSAKRKNESKGIGDLGSQPLEHRLLVAANGTPLYVRQEDEAHKIEELSPGAILTPMIHTTSGATDWYMVKTPKGNIGWVKSTDVSKQPAPK